MLILSELGLYLKEKREEQGLTLEELQKATKIQKRYLVAIEEGNYAVLPGAFYARAFVKSYSEALGLDPDEVFHTYGKELPHPVQQTSDLPSRSERLKPKRNQTAKKKSNVWSYLIGIVVIIVIALLIYVVVQGVTGGDSSGVEPEEAPSIEMDANEEDMSEENEEMDESTETNPNVDNEEEEQDKITEEEESEHSIELVSTENRRSTFYVEEMDDIDIDIELTGESYLDVKNEQGDIIQDLSQVTPGDTISLDVNGETYVQLNIGNSPNVIVRVNGEEVEYPIDTPHQYFIFTEEERE